jgi:amino acid adenylation domain-containing protein
VSTPAQLADLLDAVSARGIDLWCEGDRLRFHAPKGALGAEERALLSSQRVGIMAALRARAAAHHEELALSFPQFAMWFQHQRAPSSSVCAVGFLLKACGPLDVGALRHAAQGLVDRHPMLRTTYHLRDATLIQRIAGTLQVALEVQPHRASEATAAHAFAADIEAQIARPFNLETGPVFRVVLFTDGASEHAILVTFHHIAADGWSSRIILSELLSLYRQAVENSPPDLMRPAATYGEFVGWQSATVNGAGGERQWRYWRSVLAAPRERTLLPTEFARPAVPRFAGASVSSDLSADRVSRVQGLAARLRTTPFVVLLGAFQLLLARLCGVRDVVTGMPALGRPKAEYSSVVGNFMNVLPVRSRIEETAGVGEFLARLHATVVSALEAQDYPLLRMVQQLHLSGEETGQALFNTYFTVLANDATEAAAGCTIGGTVFDLQPLAWQAGLLDLSMDIVTSNATMHCVLKYSLDVLSAQGSADIARQYAGMIDAIIDAPERMVSALLAAPGSAAADDARAADVLKSLAARDITLTLDGDRLRVNAPKGALDAAARQAIAAERSAIIARLRAAAAQGDARDSSSGEIVGVPPVLTLPTDRARLERPRSPRAPLAVLVGRVPDTLPTRLRSVGEACDASPFMTLLAAWQVLLHRYCGQDDIVVAAAATATVPGPIRVIPIRGQLDGNPAFNQFLEQIRRTLLATESQRAPPAARCQVRFDLHASAASAPADPGPYDDAVELALEIRMPPESGEQADAQFLYHFAADLFDVDTIERLHDNFCRLLDAIVADPTTSVLDLDLLGPAEQRRLLCDSGAGEETAHADHLCVHHLLERSARLHPGHIAVSAAGEELRYEGLDSRANQLAHHLLGAGLDRGAAVAVCLERTVNIPIALAAVLKAGGAYVPLDPAHPRERLRGILRDAGAAFLITEDGFADIAAGTGARPIRLQADAGVIGGCSSASPGVPVDPHDLAYVIYTSGSTGRPKGVEVEHRHLVAFLEAMRRRPGLSAADVLLAVTTVAFDIAGLEIWLPLTVGARIVLATRGEAVDGARLAALLDAQSVTVMQATPATWRLLLESGWAGRPALRALCGGEALPKALAARLIGRVGELWNLYGPTETTIWSTAARVSAAWVQDGTALIPIGRPIANTVVRIEDRLARVVPAGVAGELLIGGAGVARGYRNQPDLTARAFVMRSIGGVSSRFYRTGDLARFRGDGQLEFLGRRDHQIKLRGHRIEPGEIEALLAGHTGITGSLVILQTTMPGDERLVAYVTVEPGASFDPDALRAALRARLPDYMVPSHFVVLPAFPLTPNGKVDRNALPPPDLTGDGPGAAAAPHITASAMTPAQQRVAVLWKEVLRVGRVGLNDNFFDIGGHSLLLVKIHAGLKREFGRELPLVELFQYTTVAQQARALEGMSHA